MAINVSKIQGGGKDRVEQAVLEAGTYPGRPVQIIDLGLQAQRPYQGKDKAPANELMVTYELVDTFMLDEEGNEIEDKPRWVSETFPLNNLKADLAKSTKRYFVLDPSNQFGGDFSQVVDTPINITLVRNDKGDKKYANVAGISAMRPKDAQNCPPLVNEPKVFDLDTPDMEVFNSLPEWIQTKITGNLNFKGSKLEVLIGGGVVKEEKAAKKKEEKQEQAAEKQDDAPW